MAYFNFQGKNIFYEEAGNGAPLLLLHGNTASSMMFADAAKMYAEHFRVILIDFLGHGRSDRLAEFPADLWFFEAEQVITLLKEKRIEGAYLIGSSGGAFVAINAALEAPKLISRVIADSFEGETPLTQFTQNIERQREMSKHDEGAIRFYTYMHGEDWESVVDCDTSAIVRNERELGKFFHGELETLKPDILFTGSHGDEFISCVSPTFFEDVYGAMLKKIGHGKMHIFKSGGHPAMLSNLREFFELSMDFLA